MDTQRRQHRCQIQRMGLFWTMVIQAIVIYDGIRRRVRHLPRATHRNWDIEREMTFTRMFGTSDRICCDLLRMKIDLLVHQQQSSAAPIRLPRPTTATDTEDIDTNTTQVDPNTKIRQVRWNDEMDGFMIIALVYQVLAGHKRSDNGFTSFHISKAIDSVKQGVRDDESVNELDTPNEDTDPSPIPSRKRNAKEGTTKVRRKRTQPYDDTYGCAFLLSVEDVKLWTWFYYDDGLRR
ncbi:Uncharacterized protein Fot_11399 [Forsythia ovata]|uniref:Uncharacterized protein n=1 Tax=Forsythia ovata TaxID=205694 RepID=A0ABD1WJK0_9LAMI